MCSGLRFSFFCAWSWPCAGAMPIFCASLSFQHVISEGNPAYSDLAARHDEDAREVGNGIGGGSVRGRSDPRRVKRDARNGARRRATAPGLTKKLAVMFMVAASEASGLSLSLAVRILSLSHRLPQGSQS